jgi:hypothetical protein
MVAILTDEGELPADGTYPSSGKHLFMTSQHRLNAYPDEIPCIYDGDRTWRVGDWIIHFPV